MFLVLKVLQSLFSGFHNSSLFSQVKKELSLGMIPIAEIKRKTPLVDTSFQSD